MNCRQHRLLHNPVTLPGDQRKDKTYKPPRKSPALSEDSIGSVTLEAEGLEIVDADDVQGKIDGGSDEVDVGGSNDAFEESEQEGVEEDGGSDGDEEDSNAEIAAKPKVRQIDRQ